jgi:hypothetical protein
MMGLCSRCRLSACPRLPAAPLISIFMFFAQLYGRLFAQPKLNMDLKSRNTYLNRLSGTSQTSQTNENSNDPIQRSGEIDYFGFNPVR